MLDIVCGIVRRTLFDPSALAQKPRQGRRIAPGRTIGVLLLSAYGSGRKKAVAAR